jgi:heme oxygenase (biliverdin-IX-beta and delta-forming)
MAEAAWSALARLAAGGRTAALGTLLDGAPYVSLVLYAAAPGLTEIDLHLSRLAVHTRNLQTDSRASLLLAEPDAGRADPQTLVRLSLHGAARVLPKAAPEYAAAQARYLAKFPASAPVFELPDFDLYRFVPTQGRFISAFGKIFDLTGEQLRKAAHG